MLRRRSCTIDDAQTYVVSSSCKKQTEYTDDEFDPMLDEDMDAGEDPDTVYTAKENIKADTTDPSQKHILIT